MRTAASILLALAVSTMAVPTVFAQGTGRSMDIDLSIRSAGMGGASNALFWGEEQNHWANPALLAETRGIRYEHGRTQLVPGLATDVFLTSDVVKLGGSGAGILLSGDPGGPGGVDLDYGSSGGTDPNGNPADTFSSFERVDAWGFGVSIVRLAEAIAVRGGERSGLSRYVDVALGMTIKHVEIQLAPATASGRAKGDCSDAGVLVRLTPVDLLRARSGLPIRLDVAYGGSVLNFNDESFVFINEDITSPATRHRRHGGAARIALDPPGLTDREVLTSPAAALLAGLSPLVSIGATRDHAEIGAGDRIDYHTDGWGFEVTFARVFSLRRGHYTDRLGHIDGETSGWSVGLPIGPYGGALYQEATFPQAEDSGLPDVHRKAFLAWIDPVAIARAFSGDRGGSLADRVPARY